MFLASISLLTFLYDMKFFPNIFPALYLLLDQIPILKFLGCLLIFLNILRSIAAFLLKTNHRFSHLEIDFAPLRVHPLTGVLELFLAYFYMDLAGE